VATINVEKAARLMGGDSELFDELFQLIESGLAEKYRNIEAALTAESGEDLEMYAHQFKGAMRNVAADDVCALLEKLERCGPQNDFVQARQLYPQVHPLIEEVLAFYRSRAWVPAFAP